ncbi:MAG: hypothetical protein V7K53_27870 [Nostoc sp.]
MSCDSDRRWFQVMNRSHKIQARKHQKERSLVSKQYTSSRNYQSA